MASEQKSRLVQLGTLVSDWTSKLFAHPYMQVGVVAFCILWFAIGWHADTLTAALSILAITLTQMVLNGQYEREGEAHRRDVAMHAKLDELISATRRARDELIGIEDLEEEQIIELKEEAKQAIDQQGERAGDPQERETAKAAVELAAAKTRKKARAKA
ncbi:low affinity iron permease family protein [Sphingomonas sp. KRR8]|jgi:low affinity Fe/Cu permease|uniref:low affinity iron permease family protein n=1 Tax=Sphingomonas sp. KRR8 TaxID=2942996 RepID=UPI0020209E5D|nr:low affinity iron permease family protein [Sphingomonas sp. KRR8]URD60460.1 low affinity iron permease family protein [Sphingomonas sp. KRR8]